jgi:SHS2 domain-containing protein
MMGTASTTACWRHFPHDADLGVEGRGATPERAFEQAAVALTRAVTEAAVEARDKVEVSCRAPDREMLLVEWLNAVIYEMAVRRMLFARFAVRTEGTHLTGVLWGEPVDVRRHAPGSEPKGATFTALRVAQEEDGTWIARCVVDV